MSNNKIAIVTGASRGIGKATAEEFAINGYDVALISRLYNDANEAAKELTAKYDGIYFPYKCDVSKEKEVKGAFSEIHNRFGRINVLVNNAGINSRKSINAKNMPDDLDDMIRGWNDEISTNLFGTYICAYLASSYMIEQGSGAIVNISSIKGVDATSSPGYGASKAGVIHLTKDFAKALAPYGIRVNCVIPGFINTRMVHELPKDKQEMYRNMIPQRRFGTVEEVSKVVFFLSSEAASYVNGISISVDGGYLIH